MTYDPNPAPADAGAIPSPVTGELVESEEVAVIPSTAEQNAGAERARGRTAVQVGIPSALITVAVWVARLAGLDLDPGAGADLPADVTAAFIALLTVVLAFRMNPKRR